MNDEIKFAEVGDDKQRLRFLLRHLLRSLRILQTTKPAARANWLPFGRKINQEISLGMGSDVPHNFVRFTVKDANRFAVINCAAVKSGMCQEQEVEHCIECKRITRVYVGAQSTAATVLHIEGNQPTWRESGERDEKWLGEQKSDAMPSVQEYLLLTVPGEPLRERTVKSKTYRFFSDTALLLRRAFP